MNYNECYDLIRDKLYSSINTADGSLKLKLQKKLENWYLEKYEKIIKKACLENNEELILEKIYEISKVCVMDDLLKLKVISIDNNYEKIKQMSMEIFEMVKLFNSNNSNFNISQKKFEQYRSDFALLEKKVSELFYDDAKKYISEALLDLIFLERKGNTNFYSIRANDYFRSLK